MVMVYLSVYLMGVVVNVVSSQQMPRIENKQYFIEVNEHTTYPFAVKLSIRNRTVGTVSTLILDERFESIERLEYVAPDESQVAVIGTLPRGGKIISVIDLVNMRLRNTIWNYGLAISPHRKYIAYRSYYPPMGLPEMKRSIVVLYPLNEVSTLPATPLANTFGYPVFPEANARGQSYDVGLDPEHLFLSPFLWSEDDKRIVFLDYENKQNYVDIVDLSSEKRQPSIRRVPIDPLRYANREIREYTRAEITRNSYKLAVDTIKWSGAEEITVSPLPQYWLPNEITLRLR
jgi:hypothetical protein